MSRREAVIKSMNEGNKGRSIGYPSDNIDYNGIRRNKMLNWLGGECSKCGFSDFRALQIDHVNGNGSLEKVRNGKRFYEKVMRSYDNDENEYQILCANCNWIKRHEKNEVRNGGKRGV